MLILIKNYINNFIAELGNKIVIGDIKIYGENKLEYVLLTNEYMASISVLSDLTYDFFVIEIKSGNSFMFKTIEFKTKGDLFQQLKDDINTFSNLRKENA
jgi:hypothetical protein